MKFLRLHLRHLFASLLHHFITLVFLVAPLTAAAQAPTPIFERWLTVGNRTVRTSLFSNRVVAVSVRRDDERVLFQRRELPEDEYYGYLAAVTRDAKELARAEDRLMTESMGGSGEIILYVGPKAPLTVNYSPIAVLDLATARLVAAIDDLERQVIWGAPSDGEIQEWQPNPGDWVELRSGLTAHVVEVQKDGTLVLGHDDVSINEVVPPTSRASVILRVLEEDP